ncbi:MAG: hypothetical protein LIO53_09615 [Oscillospiraceae bacterium]|nr:hypothetical protein [Oscillospiraceae bacterium]
MKKIISGLLAAVMCLGTMAFAADVSNETVVADEYPTTITLPNGEVQQVPVAEPATAMTADASTAAVSAGTYTISKLEEFEAITESQWFSGSTFYITGDLDLSSISVDEWYGVIKYFYGTITGVKKADGTYPVITGIPNNCSFIYAIAGGTIENLTFKHVINDETNEGGSASFITFLPTSYGGKTYELVMKNITVKGDISLTGFDQSNYSPFVYCVSDGGLTMEKCVNEANISGSIYGAIFHGYYPLYVGTYTFTDCVNYGDITMQYAGMFFGNSYGLETKLTNSTLIINDCANYGTIRGTSAASYLVAPVASSGIGTVATQVESVLNPEITDSTDSIPSTFSISKILTESEDYGDGHLYEGNALDGFKATLDSEDSTSVVITRPDVETDVEYYVIAVSAYVNLWKKTNNTFDGTDRYTVKQKIGKTDFTTDTFEPTLKVYGFADSDVGTYETTIYSDYEDYDDYKVYSYNDKYYYRISDNMEGSDVYALYVSSEIDEETNQPVGGGVKNAQIVTISAYKADGTMLGCITINP